MKQNAKLLKLTPWNDSNIQSPMMRDMPTTKRHPTKKDNATKQVGDHNRKQQPEKKNNLLKVVYNKETKEISCQQNG